MSNPNKTCIKVESLSSGKLNLQKVIEVAPPDFINSNLITEKVCQSASPKVTDNNLKQLRVLLPFNNEATKHRIVDWLNKNCNKFDKLSPTPLGEESTNFQMPSISQGKPNIKVFAFLLFSVIYDSGFG